MIRMTSFLPRPLTHNVVCIIVASFRNGPPPPSKRSDLSFEVFENPAKKQRLVVSSSERVAYQGANFGYLSPANDFAKYVSVGFGILALLANSSAHVAWDMTHQLCSRHL